MTEHDWLSSTDPQAMLHLLTSWDGPLSRPSQGLIAISERRLRLFASACAVLSYGYEHATTDGYGNWINGEADPDDFAAPTFLAETWCSTDEISKELKIAVLREIVGNPFHTYAWTDCHDCSPSGHNLQCLDKRWLVWQDNTIPRLAQRIYNERDWDAIPVLGDALEEAGCQVEEIVRHCRGQELCIGCSLPGHERSGWCEVCGQHTDEVSWMRLRGPHCRGCWVVDLILGKE